MYLSTQNKKYNRVIEKNTFFFHYDDFEETYESYVSSLVQLLLLLKQHVEAEGLTKDVFTSFIMDKQDGLKALLALIGFSDEMLYRLITFVRATDDSELNALVNKADWPEEDFTSEWKGPKILSIVRSDWKIAEGLVNLFFEGSTIPFIRDSLPLFEFKKLDLSKLNFTYESLMDTIIRYKVKGSYNAQKENNPEAVLGKLLTQNGIKWEKGNRFRSIVGRDMDFLIPDKENPCIFIECSYVATTSSGMGDKAANEVRVAENIKQKYQRAFFLGFVDGVGWYVRRSDLQVIVRAFDEVFTFHPDELERFIRFLQGLLPKECYQ